MAAISTWSTSAASNNSISPDGFPENMAPSGVNNSAREVMASVRTWYNNYEWRDFGHTVTRTANTTFTVATDVTAIYIANRPITCTDSTTLYGYVVSSAYSAPNTTVTVSLDSGNLSSSLTAVALGFIPSNSPIAIQSIRSGNSALGIATQSDMETATSLARLVTPGVVQYHPGVAKAYINFTTSGGTVTVRRTYNVTSLTDNGVGDFTVNFTTAFSDGLYLPCGVVKKSGSTCTIVENADNPVRTTTANRIYIGNDANGLSDPDICSIIYFGDQ